MTAVTRRTSRRRQVAASRHRLVMDTLGVVRELCGRQSVRRHQFRFRMAATTGCSDIQRVYWGLGIRFRADVMDPVAIGAHRYMRITFCELNAMDAGVILR